MKVVFTVHFLEQFQVCCCQYIMQYSIGCSRWTGQRVHAVHVDCSLHVVSMLNFFILKIQSCVNCFTTFIFVDVKIYLNFNNQQKNLFLILRVCFSCIFNQALMASSNLVRATLFMWWGLKLQHVQVSVLPSLF